MTGQEKRFRHVREAAQKILSPFAKRVSAEWLFMRYGDERHETKSEHKENRHGNPLENLASSGPERVYHLLTSDEPFVISSALSGFTWTTC
jgi:hypothetical protein